MRAFADLYEALDRTTSTTAKVDALAAYFGTTPPADAAWALFFLTGRRLKRFLPGRAMVDWTAHLTGLPDWMFGECYGAVGDVAEMVALLLDTVPHGTPAPGVPDASVPLSVWMTAHVLTLRGLDEEDQRARVLAWWAALDRRERFLLNKILSGEFRVGVSQTLVVRGLAQAAGLPTPVIEHRLMGQWEPNAEFVQRVLAPETAGDDHSQPYPFFLASPLEGAVETLGDRSEWLAEWKWDGIRAQLVKRQGEVFVWSRGEELVTQRFPEISRAAAALPDGTVLDGEILPFRDGRPLPFAALQRRIGRERQVKEVARDVPVVFMTYDLLEDGGRDIRAEPLVTRRARLRELLQGLDPAAFLLSAELDEPTWEALAARRAASRDLGVEGLMLKRAASAYATGRRKGDWWKWKVAPFTIDAVLLYAQPGNGRRANLFTDYTFGVWHEGELIPVAKAYSGLSNEEIAEVDRWVRRHTVERFGPVSAVPPVHVFELGFEAIAASTRHKSGIAVRFPRILRWRKDKPASEADTLESVRELLDRYGRDPGPP